MADELDTASAVSQYLGARSTQDTVRTSLALASGLNPDEEAEYKRLALKSGIPIDSVRDNKAAVQQKLAQPNAEELATKFPSTTKYLSTLENARIAHDDLPALTQIEKGVRSFMAGGQFKEEAKATVGFLGRVPGAILSGAPKAGAGLYGLAAAPFELVGLDGVGGFLRDQQRSANAEAARWSPQDPNAGIVERGVMSGLQSAGQNLITLPMGFAGKGEGMLGAMGAITFGQSYGKGRDAGLSPARAVPYGVQDAVAEVVTERYLGASGFLQQIKAGASAGKLFMYELAKEVPGEMAATLWQNFNEWTNLNPNKTVADFVKEQPAALAETVIATLVGGTTQIGAVKATEKMMGVSAAREQKAQQAESAAMRAEQFAGIVEQSKLRERDPEAFKQFLQGVTEDGQAPAEFYIDAEQLANTLNQSAITMDELRAVAPEVAAQLDAAKFVPGADVRVPMTEFATVPPEVTKLLLDHLREAPDSMSRAEAQEYLKTEGDRIKKDVESVLGDETARADRMTAADTASKVFEEQLTAAGRFRPEVNKAYAAVLGNFYATQAERSGFTVEEFMDRYQLRVVGKESAAPLGKRQKLEQAPQQSRPDPVKQREMIELRKQESVLKSLITCLGGA